MMRRRVKAALQVLVLVTGAAACAGSPSDGGAEAEGDGGPYVTDEVTDPERMAVDPAVVAPGESIHVRFPAGDIRGPGFVLERRIDAGWIWEWAIVSDPEAEPTVISADEFRRREMVWLSGPAFDGPETHELPVPVQAEPGTYRACTTHVERVLCAEFEVESDG
jgi:hypothetical protein